MCIYWQVFRFIQLSISLFTHQIFIQHKAPRQALRIHWSMRGMVSVLQSLMFRVWYISLSQGMSNKWINQPHNLVSLTYTKHPGVAVSMQHCGWRKWEWQRWWQCGTAVTATGSKSGSSESSMAWRKGWHFLYSISFKLKQSHKTSLRIRVRLTEVRIDWGLPKTGESSG